jgi:hypothetical protein
MYAIVEFTMDSNGNWTAKVPTPPIAGGISQDEEIKKALGAALQNFADVLVKVQTAAPATDSGKELDRQLDLYKTEYATAATRYQNQYAALWQNFNYMAVLAAGVLAFGKDDLGLSVAALLGAVILASWYWISFEPLNRYGHETATRLSMIEQIINKTAGLVDESGKLEVGLQSFKEFESSREPHRKDLWWLLGLAIPLGISLCWTGANFRGKWCDVNWQFFPWAFSVTVAALLGLGVIPLLIKDFTPSFRVRTVVRAIWLGLHIAIVFLLLHISSDWGAKLRSDSDKNKPEKVTLAQIERIYALHDSGAALTVGQELEKVRQDLRSLKEAIVQMSAQLPATQSTPAVVPKK